MTRPLRRLALRIGLLTLCVNAASAAMVRVNVMDQRGAPAGDTVIAFDPLDVKPAASRNQATIDQIDKQFVPRVSVIRTGTSVTFPNSDRIRHQVYSFSKPNVFSLKLYAGSPADPVAFDKPGLVVLGCNIHDRMAAFVAVVDTPYFATTTAAGTAALDLPAGRYRLRVWNPHQTAILMREIIVQAEPMILPAAIDLDAESRLVAAWPE